MQELRHSPCLGRREVLCQDLTVSSSFESFSVEDSCTSLVMGHLQRIGAGTGMKESIHRGGHLLEEEGSLLSQAHLLNRGSDRPKETIWDRVQGPQGKGQLHPSLLRDT